MPTLTPRLKIPMPLENENFNRINYMAALQAIEDGAATLADLSTHKSASTLDHPDGSVTDAKIGDRTADPSQAPTGNGPGKLAKWLSWITNRIKAITGATNWWDAPATTLAAAKAHADASAPHFGHATTAALTAHTGAANPHSGSAPLASPALTGTPTAPTPATADSSTKLATTAFVKNQGYITAGGAPVQSVAGRTGAVVLTAADAPIVDPGTGKRYILAVQVGALGYMEVE